MAEYLRPDVYVEETISGEKPIQSVSTSTGAFVGVTARGKVGEAVLVTSWTDFVNKFALGLDTPFIKNSDLPNAVFGFFQNGGARCYIVRVAPTGAKNAKCNIASEGLEIQAKDPGSWANQVLKVKVVANASNFNVEVYMKNERVEVIENLSNTLSDINYFKDVINDVSNYIMVADADSKDLVVTEESVALVGGDDAIATLEDTDFEKGLSALNVVEDVNLVAVPDRSSIAQKIIDYCEGRGCHPILEAPKDATLETVKEFREELQGDVGALYFPHIKIVDPIGRNSKSLKVCSPVGHIMGVYARIDSTRGVHKAPAGEECILKGVTDLSINFPFTSISELNPLGINCLITKPNKGIMIWGARSLSDNNNKKYVSDVRYDLMVRKSVYEGTQYAIFEPNDSELWNRIDTSLRSFLDSEHKKGALRGATSEEAYYVKCDAELNTDSVIDEGKVVAEIGYAKQKPAEFVIVKIVQMQNK